MKAKHIKIILSIVLDIFIILTPFYITGVAFDIIHLMLLFLWTISAFSLIYKLSDIKLVNKENLGFRLYFNILADIGIILSWSWYYGDLVYGALIVLVRLGIIYRVLEYRESEERNETEKN
jgi:hypothetical protein